MSIMEQINLTLRRHPGMTLPQVLYLRYLSAILIDLVVIGLLNEYWSKVEITSFSVALITAVLLQVLLQASLILEEKSSDFFKAKKGVMAKFLRFFSAWVILFISKLIILWVIDYFFGNSFMFHGRFHGVVPFLVLVVCMIAAEMMTRFLFHRLGKQTAE